MLYLRPDTRPTRDPLDDPCELGADLAEVALATATSRMAETDAGFTMPDVVDLVAHLMHFCDRAGLQFPDVAALARDLRNDDRERAGGPAVRDDRRFETAV